MAAGDFPLAEIDHQVELPPDEFERIKRRVALLATSTGGIACFIAASLAHLIDLPNPVDMRILPTLGLGLLLLFVTLWFKPALQPWVERIGWGFLTVYLITALSYQILQHPLEATPLGVRAYWFFFTYLLAFLIWSPLGGLFSSLAVIGALSILTLWLGIETHSGNMQMIVSLVQLIVASIAYAFLHYSFAQLRPQYTRMRALAFTDPLTGYANRRRAEELLQQEVLRAERYGHPLTVVMFDLDHFKYINDEYGHAIGDAVLRGVTHAVSNDLRAVDHLTRWGGEEFLIIAPEVAHSRAAVFGERLRKRIAALRIGSNVRPTASFGIACFRPGDTVDTLVERADQAMYQAKEQGRNRVELEPPLSARFVSQNKPAPTTRSATQE